MDNLTTASDEMTQRVAALEAELGGPIDNLPFDPSDVDYQRWTLTEDYHSRWTLELARPWIARSAGRIATTMIGGGVLLLLISGGAGGYSPWQGVGFLAIPLLILGLAFAIGWAYHNILHSSFRFDPGARTLEHNMSLWTAGKQVLGKTISLDRIAAIQLCGAVTNKGPLAQMNLVLADPAGDRVKLIEFMYRPDSLIGLGEELADAIGKPLIIHETANLVDLVDVSNWGRRRPRTAKSKGPRTPKKKADFLSAFDDKLKPDDKAKE